MPIYWITCPLLEEGELAQAIADRQRWDWRNLRFKTFEAEEVQRDLSGLAAQIDHARRNVLRVVESSEKIAVNGSRKPSNKPVPELETGPPPPKPTPGPKAFEIFRDLDKPLCPEIVMLPAGTFLMGSPETETAQYEDEGPQHKVKISLPFVLGRYPVTFDESDHFCDQTRRKKPEDEGFGRDRRPMINVDHEDTEACCSWLSQETSRLYHLSSEAQWEYACRARTKTTYAFGDELTEQQVNFNEKIDKTSEVGAYPANAWSLHDMLGNVYQWWADWLGRYSSDAAVDPKGPPTGALRVVRGGSWDGSARRARSACRSGYGPGHRNDFLGFRCAGVQEQL